MTRHRITNIALATLIAAAMSMAYLLDGTPTEAHATRDTMQDLVDAQRDAYVQARHQARFARAAQKACAGHGTAQVLADNSIQCSGTPSTPTTTIIAKVAL